MERKRKTTRFIFKTNLSPIVSFLFMLSIFTLIFSSTTTGTTIACSDASKCPMFSKAHTDHQKTKRVNFEYRTKISLDWVRRFLGGPGSSPPQCTSKCGKCQPCKPVHVVVPPGTPVTAEYYPEAWRCKCGNKLSMP